jgi:hypothetical protein
LTLGVDVFEIKLGDEFLMSSLFTASEIALARLGLAGLSESGLDVVVGGLGLGYTAKAVLEHRNVASLIVVEALEAVIDWHAEGLVPLGPELTGDPRCRFVQGNFFALAASDAGFDPAAFARTFDAVLVDIDHSPDFLLDPQNAAFYRDEGLSRLAAHLRPGGIFALWSNDCPDGAFTARLGRIFANARAGGDVSQPPSRQAVHANDLSREKAGDFRGALGLSLTMHRDAPSRRYLYASPISRNTSAVCSPSRGAGRSAAAGLPSIMIGVRTPGMVPALAAALGRSIRMPRWTTCGSANT